MRQTGLCDKHGPHNSPRCGPCIEEQFDKFGRPHILGEKPDNGWRYAGDYTHEAIENATAARIAAFIRRPHEDGTPCSAEREMLAQRIERGDWRK